MEAYLEEIREQQRTSWNKFSPGWKKWDELFMDFLSPMGDEIIRRLEPKASEWILDIASGTGEPGLAIATQVGNGKVVIADVAENMLEIAKENALRRGVFNIETRVCDVCEMPFEDNTFDAISCRFGFMFFPDMVLAAKEMARVLKPGGRMATAVWNIPEKNFWITAMMGAINKYLELPAPPAGAPGMFRCAHESLIADIFSQVGLKNISVKEVNGKLDCRTVDIYWNVMTEVAAPVVAALSRVDDTVREKIRSEVYRSVNQKYPDGDIMIDSSSLIIYGEK